MEKAKKFFLTERKSCILWAFLHVSSQLFLTFMALESKMSTATYDQIEKRVSDGSEKIGMLCDRYVKIPVNYAKIVIGLSLISYGALRASWLIRHIEKSCASCKADGCSIQDNLRKIVSNLDNCIATGAKVKIPPAFLSVIEYSAEYIDNKIENIALASDKEFRELVFQVAEKTCR